MSCWILVLRYASHDFEQIALMVVRGGDVRGWSHKNCNITLDGLRRLSLPWQVSRVLRDSVEGRRAFVGVVDEAAEGDRWLATSLNLSGKVVHCLPLMVNGAPVAYVIAAHPTSGADGFPKSYGELATRFSYAVQMLYLRRRLLA